MRALTPTAGEYDEAGAAIQDQIALTAVHSWVCTSRKDLFTAPPLPELEASCLFTLPKDAYVVTDLLQGTTSVFEYVKQVTGYQGEEKSLERDATTTTSALPEPQRTIILLLLRQILAGLFLLVPPPEDSPAFAPTANDEQAWRLFSLWAGRVVTHPRFLPSRPMWAGRLASQTPPPVLELFRPAFLEALYFAPLALANPPVALVERKLAVIKAAVARVPIDDEVKEDAVRTLDVLFAPV
ncbi:hypothetical protein JCM10207_007716 [Rhodosporidiobolus poonsookiae]